MKEVHVVANARRRMDLKVRNARVDDSVFLAWLILTAGRAHVRRGIWEVILDQPEEDCLSFLELLTITNTPDLFHHSCFLIAEIEAGPVSVEARFVLWQGKDVLQLPTSALFRQDSGWAVFVLKGGRATLTPVKVGQRAGLRTQVLSGLDAGVQVITHPDDRLSDGVRVKPR